MFIVLYTIKLTITAIDSIKLVQQLIIAKAQKTK